MLDVGHQASQHHPQRYTPLVVWIVVIGFLIGVVVVASALLSRFHLPDAVVYLLLGVLLFLSYVVVNQVLSPEQRASLQSHDQQGQWEPFDPSY